MTRLKGLAACSAALLLSLASVDAAGADARLVDAVKAADKPAVRALLEQRVDVNAPEADGTTALHWAANKDDSEVVDLLIRAGAGHKRARHRPGDQTSTEKPGYDCGSQITHHSDNGSAL